MIKLLNYFLFICLSIFIRKASGLQRQPSNDYLKFFSEMPSGENIYLDFYVFTWRQYQNLELFNTRSTVGVILTHSIMLFAYICKVDLNRDLKLPDFS